MSNLHLFRSRELTPFEKFKRLNPQEAKRLAELIASKAGCQEPMAQFLLQEITNALYRAATQKTRELGVI